MNRILIAAALLSGCAFVPTESGRTSLGTIRTPVLATDNAGSKTGRACSSNTLGFYGVGDSTIETAKKKASITRVASVDKEVNGYLFYSETCTIVTGE
ncbi:MAG: TRL-like family protein [Rickettsiales bacterium]|jgi:hypothetical protein|nr:TRL-like family protein [Rickettsiales bacterium]